MRFSTMSSQQRTLKPPIKISILEKNSNDVSYCWKACQLFSYVIVVISGIATSMAIGNIQRMFNDECVLYSNLTVDRVNQTEIHIKPGYQHWGARDNCNYCQFLPVASVICAGIWGTLFVMCGRGGGSSRNLPQPWRIVPPAIVFNFVFVILTTVSVVLTFGGFAAFCSSIQASVNISSCDDLMDYSWKHYPNASFFYDDVIIAETGSAITLAGWLIGFLILLVRCISHADFLVIPRVVSNHPSVQSASQSTVFSTVNTSSTTPHSSPATTPEKSSNIEAEPLIIVATGSGPIKKTKTKTKS